MSYPFRFYGARPGDWFEGANCGHAYEVRFVDPPDAEARRAIAAAFETAALDTPIDPCGAWRWAGAWALLFVGEREAGADGLWDAIEDVWRAVHAAAPLALVHFAGTRAVSASDAWSAWSVAEGPIVDAPAWPGFDLDLGAYGRGTARGPVEPAEDPAFERARGEARRAAADARRDAVRARAEELGGALLVHRDDVHGGGEAPEPAPLPDALAELADTIRVHRAFAGGIAAVVDADDGLQLQLFPDDAAEPVAAFPVRDEVDRLLASPDGRLLLVGAPFERYSVERPTVLLAVDADGARLLGTTRHEAKNLYAAGGALILWTEWSEAYEVVNAPGAIDAALACPAEDLELSDDLPEPDLDDAGA